MASRLPRNYMLGCRRQRKFRCNSMTYSFQFMGKFADEIVIHFTKSSLAWGLLSIWAVITVCQVAHEFQHSHSQHHCDAHVPTTGSDAKHPGISTADHACLICDWEWAPSDPSIGFAPATSMVEWVVFLVIGNAQSSFASSGHSTANALRGPPLKG